MSDDWRDMRSAASVISRLAAVFGAPSDAALAKEIGIPATTLNSRKTRNSVPYEECVDVSSKKGCSLDWLLLGEGPVMRSEKSSGVDEDLLAWTIAGVLSWLDKERAETPPTPTSQLVIGTYRVIAATSPRPDTPEKVAAQVKGVLDGFRHLIR